MRKLKVLISLLLIITTPSLLAYPQPSYPSTTISAPKTTQETQLFDPQNLPTYDEIIDLLNQIESGDLENKYTSEDLNRINSFIAHLAREGAFIDDSDDLENDIAALLESQNDSFEYAFASDDYMFIPAICNGKIEITHCKSWLKKNWQKTKEFVKEHKKEIIIGAVIVIAATVVVVAIVATTTTAAAGAAAGAAGAAASSVPHNEEKTHSTIDTPQVLEAANEAPTLIAALDEHMASFKDFAAEDVIIQSTDIYKDPSFIEKARDFGSFLAHETLDEISEIASVIPKLSAELKDLSSKFLSQDMIPSEDDTLWNPCQNFEYLVTKGHQIIDKAFSTEQAEFFTPEAKANDPTNNYVIGLIPPPGNFSKGLNISKFRQILETGKETVVLAEELGYSAKEIAQLEKTGALEETVTKAFESLVNKPAMQESLELFNNAKTLLEPYQGKYLPEIQIRECIHQAGIRTFPRPKGIPENFLVRITDKGAGMEYIHPSNTHISVRVMPGKPHSPNPSQQKPYVIQKKDGKAFDKYGNLVNQKSPEAHIPLEEFIYRK